LPTYFGDVKGNEAGEHPASQPRQEAADEEQLVAGGGLAAAHRDGTADRQNLKQAISK
jgi:hypothetical protein